MLIECRVRLYFPKQQQKVVSGVALCSIFAGLFNLAFTGDSWGLTHSVHRTITHVTSGNPPTAHLGEESKKGEQCLSIIVNMVLKCRPL